MISFNIIFRYKKLPSFHSWWCTRLYQHKILSWYRITRSSWRCWSLLGISGREEAAFKAHSSHAFQTCHEFLFSSTFGFERDSEQLTWFLFCEWKKTILMGLWVNGICVKHYASTAFWVVFLNIYITYRHQHCTRLVKRWLSSTKCRCHRQLFTNEMRNSQGFHLGFHSNNALKVIEILHGFFIFIVQKSYEVQFIAKHLFKAFIYSQENVNY